MMVYTTSLRFDESYLVPTDELLWASWLEHVENEKDRPEGRP